MVRLILSAEIQAVKITDVRSITIYDKCIKTFPCKHSGLIVLFNGKQVECNLYTPQWHVLADSAQKGRVIGTLCPNMRPTAQNVEEILNAAFNIFPPRYSGNINSCCPL